MITSNNTKIQIHMRKPFKTSWICGLQVGPYVTEKVETIQRFCLLYNVYLTWPLDEMYHKLNCGNEIKYMYMYINIYNFFSNKHEIIHERMEKQRGSLRGLSFETASSV